jgi:hypothetical protein
MLFISCLATVTTWLCLLGRGHIKETGNRNATAISENCYQPELNTLLNGAAQTEETATQFPQFALLHSVTYVQLRLITVLGNCGCVAVASFLGVPSPLQTQVVPVGSSVRFHLRSLHTNAAVSVLWNTPVQTAFHYGTPINWDFTLLQLSTIRVRRS